MGCAYRDEQMSKAAWMVTFPTKSVRVEGFPGPGPQIPTAIGVPTRQALEASKGIGLEPKEEMDEEFGEGAGLVMLCHGCDGYVDMMNTEARLSSVSLCILY